MEKPEIIGKRPWPNWTVVYNIARPDATFVGKGWEFFYNEDVAQRCYNDQIKSGNVPTKRPFHPSDKKHMNPVDVLACGGMKTRNDIDACINRMWLLYSVVAKTDHEEATTAYLEEKKRASNLLFELSGGAKGGL